MDGILVINKEKGWTSQDVVAKIKKICNTKVGHIGTLDPLAEGVLPLLLGKGTKLSKYLIEHDKIYEAEIKLGEKTDTGDSEGKIIEKKSINEENLKKENVIKVLQKFKGKQKQKPPIYSAIKIKGKKLYEYARKGEKVEIPERQIEIFEIELLNIDENSKAINFRVHCSKGTYIRRLCEDIAEKLETVGYMKKLNRIKVGNFSIEKSVTIQKVLENRENKLFWDNNFITIEIFFENYNSIELNNRKNELFLNGVKLTENREDGFYKIYYNNKFIGIGTVENKLLKREIVL